MPQRTRHIFLWFLLGILAGVCIFLGFYIPTLGPALKSRIISALELRFNADVQLSNLHVSVYPLPSVDGEGLVISPKDRLPNSPPMIQIHHFHAQTGFTTIVNWRELVDEVDLDGLQIHLPPRTAGHNIEVGSKTDKGASQLKFIIRKIVANHALIQIEPKPGKDPLIFPIESLVITSVGPGQAMAFTAQLTNAKPPGAINTTGHFGPWHSDDPRSTSVDGHYTFTNADLNTIKGIGGTLSSTGDYTGRLDHITIDGTANVPNFSLDISDHPVPLATTFHAYVDATNGDTTLDPVTATLEHSHFTTRGTVVNIHGKGHDIRLLVHMPNGRIDDLLQLGMKSQPPILRGAVTLDAKLHIPPGDVRVAQKIELAGTVHIQHVEFTNAKLQDRIDSLSARAQGHPGDSKADGSDLKPEVASQMTVDFSLGNALLLVPSLHYEVPGGAAQMHGAYTVNASAFQFFGHISTTAKVSQMVTGWKSILLTPFDPLFSKHGKGFDLPVSIGGVKNDVHFGLAMHGTDETPQQIVNDLRTERTTYP